MIKLTINTIRKITNKIHATLLAAPATPEKPRMPAIIATTRKMIDHRNMEDSFYVLGNVMCGVMV